MKVATILPTEYLHLIEGNPYHMALAHLVGKDEEYTAFYKEESAKGAYVILDNGVIENDQQRIDLICSRAKKIGAQEIILPDVFLNEEETLASTYGALNYVKACEPQLKTMAVPQGKTIDEWLECAKLLLDGPFDTIGIPKVLTKLGGRDARLYAIKRLNDEYGELLKTKEIHLLGCWENPIECTMIAKAIQQGMIPEVRGVDSGIAYVYAREGLLINQAERPSGAINFGAKDADETILKENIEIWQNSVSLDPKVFKIS